MMQGSDSTVINQIGDITATVLTGRHNDTAWGNIDHFALLYIKTIYFSAANFS
jgi:hypothetical protein